MEIYMVKSRFHHFGIPFDQNDVQSTTPLAHTQSSRHITIYDVTSSTTASSAAVKSSRTHIDTSSISSTPASVVVTHVVNHKSTPSPSSSTAAAVATTTTTTTSSSNTQQNFITASLNTNNDETITSTFIQFLANATNSNYVNNSLLLWNAANTNDSTSSVNFTFDGIADLSSMGIIGGNNVTSIATNYTNITSSWSFQCLEWSAAQHNLFQTANLFFAAAFCVPPSFKQSVLFVRALLAVGFILCTFWGGMEICALDILLWNFTLSLLNILHTVILTWRFLPPALNLELTELYLKVFKPYRVSKKHFKELAREARILTLEKGDIYAVEQISSADERLSILLRGKLRVTCDDTHLHFITQHQFIDSPEWESNHEQSDDVFQVTITAEEDCIYLCWPRMRLERVLRHRPTVKVVLDSIIGKDITQKLYSLNEHLRNTREIESDRLSKKASSWMTRSLSVDAVNTGTKGHVRSTSWKSDQHRRPSITSSDNNSPFHQRSTQHWVPLQANHFMPTSPFTQPCGHPQIHQLPSVAAQILTAQNVVGSSSGTSGIASCAAASVTTPLLAANTSTSIPLGEYVTYPPTDALLTVPPPVITTVPLEKKRLFRNSFRRNKETKTQVKFQKQVKEVCYNSLPQRPI